MLQITDNMNRPYPQPHSRFRVIATLLVLFFGASLAAPCARALAALPPVVVETSSVPDKFAAAAPQRAHGAVCACLSCPGSHGGKCCCKTAPTADDGYALRAVCDTAPDAASPLSPLPPVILPRTLTPIVPVFAPVVTAPTGVAPHRRVYLDRATCRDSDDCHSRRDAVSRVCTGSHQGTGDQLAL